MWRQSALEDRNLQAEFLTASLLCAVGCYTQMPRSEHTLAPLRAAALSVLGSALRQFSHLQTVEIELVSG